MPWRTQDEAWDEAEKTMNEEIAASEARKQKKKMARERREGKKESARAAVAKEMREKGEAMAKGKTLEQVEEEYSIKAIEPKAVKKKGPEGPALPLPLTSEGKALLERSADSVDKVKRKDNRPMVKKEVLKGMYAARPEGEKAVKRSISLYPWDFDTINVIMDHAYRERGLRISRSQAITVALRLVKISDEIFPILDAIKLEDKRGRR